ncbi:MAG: thioredoxin family protein, partial [Bacteroidia bacterium]
MRSVPFLFLGVLMFFTLSAKAQLKDEKTPAPDAKGINFFHGSLDEALDLARSQKKLVFIDAFTEWCGPCKMMAATTFLDEKVANFFNESFINVKLDMEKGEGPDVAAKYKVNAYPTLLFLNPRGSLLHTIVGFRKAPEFLEEARTAVNPKTNTAA